MKRKLSDIKQLVTERHTILKDRFKSEEEKLKKEFFQIYDTVEEIQKLKTDLDNGEGVEYQLDEYGELQRFLTVPMTISSLPFVGNYLTSDSGFFDYELNKYGEYCGEFISIDRNRTRMKRYDGKVIGFDENLKDEKISLLIEKHIQETGIFGDVVRIDPWSNYCELYNHVEYLPERVREATKSIIDSKEVIKMIDEELERLG